MARFFAKVAQVLIYVVFIYQFCTVTQDYLQYRTTTKVEPITEDPTDLPAFTFDFRTPIPIQELYLKAFPGQRYPFENTTYVKRPKWYGSDLQPKCRYYLFNDSENEITRKIGGLSRMIRLYACVYHFYPNLTITEYFEMLHSVFDGWRNISNIEIRPYFQCYSGDKDIVQDEYIDWHDICEDWMEFSFGFQGTLGITLFSNVTSGIKFRANSRLNIGYAKLDLQPFKDQRAYVQLHAPGESPHPDLFRRLVDEDHEITYHRKTIRRLPPPYETFCHDYKKAPINGSTTQNGCLAQMLL